VALIVTLGVSLAGFSLAAEQDTVTFWHGWGAGSDIDQAFQAVARAYEEVNPGTTVEVLSGKNEEQVTLAVAGGVPPDGCIIDGPKVSSYAVSGVIQDITDFVERDNVMMEDFVIPAWRECIWQDRIYAIPWGADPNFGLFRNKEILSAAGFDPRHSPETIPQLDSVGRKLTKVDSDGKVTQVGIVPWHVYGWANSIYTWGWVFGGKFYDYVDRTITADHPRNVKALEWMRSYVDRYGWANMDGLGFMNGNVAFQPYGPWELPRLQSTAEFEYTLSVMPYHPDGGKHNPTWVGGHRMAIPSGAQNRAGGWRFIMYMAADPEGSAILAEPLNWFPGYIKSDVYDIYREQEYVGIFADILMTASHQRPVIPVGQTYWEELEKAVSRVLQEGTSPLQALKRVDEVVQSKLDELLANLD